MPRLLRIFLSAVAVILAVSLIGQRAYAKGSEHSYSSHSGSDVHVNGYYRANGTYVASNMRSAPDGIKSNNWSTKGNVNPYTGKVGTKAPGPAEPPPRATAQAANNGPTKQTSGASTRPRPSRYSMPADPVRRTSWKAVKPEMTSTDLEQTLGVPNTRNTVSDETQDWRYTDGVVRVSHGKAIAWMPREVESTSAPNQ